MKLVIQRVNEASVKVAQEIVGQIQKGLLIYLGVDKEDSSEDVAFCVQKVLNLRIFEDAQGKMNLSILDLGIENNAKNELALLVVYQFTLLGDCTKGRRPSFDQAAAPEKGEEYYEMFIAQLRDQGVNVQTGKFRAMMDIYSINDGPVTFILESKKGK